MNHLGFEEHTRHPCLAGNEVIKPVEERIGPEPIGVQEQLDEARELCNLERPERGAQHEDHVEDAKNERV